LRGHAEAITATGATIAAVGTGGRAYAGAFKAEQGIGFPLLVDPQLASFRVAGARKGTLAQFANLSTLRAGFRALRGGSLQGRTGHHPLMLGATHVILPDGTVPFAWVNDGYGDSAPVEDVLDVLR
jgi:peroxiredoxin